MYICMKENDDGGVLQTTGSATVALAEEDKEDVSCTADSETYYFAVASCFHLLFSLHCDNMKR